MTGHRVRLAMEERRWQDAEHLQRARVDWNRQRARPALAAPPETRDNTQRNYVRTLAVSLHHLGEIQHERGVVACIESYQEAFRIGEAIHDRAMQALSAVRLGRAFGNMPEVRDLDEAERWCQCSLDLRPLGDNHIWANGLVELGTLAYERFKEAVAARHPAKDLGNYLTKATKYYEQALELFPETAVKDRGVAHNQLGNIYSINGEIDRALHHYQQDIRYCEAAGDIYGAGQTRANVAIALARAGRLDDARAYAEAALANFSTFGDRAPADIEGTQRLIARIDEAKAQGSSNL